ncbi:ABC transporter substrate-binding protein [Allosediminivita pacifica]|uniref:Peptide/nickel transport system substrate-binding protein n=1 Tax=Allosediminivita pacifica TaxID=1267769 RepID=A0A2T6ATT9_9RHOB|nr:ABC transporter substrate-binding protein [Allosediminivita pacifica]PTX47232.1 peptide/nickel transport system substrate-binding protein [Allosediminivita pacifica]GGB09231.1 ABC transporter substrate-binding protein [Allosediminivita pacifica]
MKTSSTDLDRRAFLGRSAAFAAATGSTSLSLGLAGARPAEAQAKPLVIAAPATPQSLDSEFDGSLGTLDMIGCLYDSLVAFETVPDPEIEGVMREDVTDYPDLPGGVKITGKLAESWEVAEDSSWAEFKLREGVLSNWGNELTAEDVVYTWERKFALGAIGGFFTKLLGMSGPENVTAVDTYTVRFELPQPNPLLMKLQLNLYNNILDGTKCREMATEDDPWARDFIANDSAGFGPYRLANLVRGQQAVLVGREDYWNGMPAIQQVVYREVPTSATRSSLVRGGAVDIALVLQPLEIEQLAQTQGVKVASIEASPMFWVELNTEFAPFDQVAVRQAMNYAFPKEQVIETIYRGTADPMTGPMPAIYPGFKPTADYRQDLERARALLAEAGLADGFETSLAYNAGDPIQEPMAILYQTALREIGVELSLRKIPAGTYFNEVSGRTQPMIFFTDTPWCPDPGYSMQLYFDSATFSNYSNYANERVDELLRAASLSPDNAERFKMMAEAQDIIGEEAPWVFIGYPKFTVTMRENVEGLTYYTSNNLRFQDFSYASS